MDEGWTRWLLEQYGFEFVTLHPEDFKTPLGDKVDVLILADDARIPVEGGGRRARRRGGQAGAARRWPERRRAVPPPGGGRRGGAGRAVRPEYAYTLTRGRPAGVRRVRPRRRHPRLLQQRVRGSPCSSSSCR